ncbi:MAG: hypothetical protein HC850_11580, partial [Rhodomicrobium sp.]|nr:hypothetical protein [Rhodomicrobium sp.]
HIAMHGFGQKRRKPLARTPDPVRRRHTDGVEALGVRVLLKLGFHPAYSAFAEMARNG